MKKSFMLRILWILILGTPGVSMAKNAQRKPASFEDLPDAKISISAGQQPAAAGAIAASISISFSGDLAKRVYDLLKNAPGTTEKQESWGTTRSSADQNVVCGLSVGQKGESAYNCVSSNPL